MALFSTNTLSIYSDRRTMILPDSQLPIRLIRNFLAGARNFKIYVTFYVKFDNNSLSTIIRVIYFKALN